MQSLKHMTYIISWEQEEENDLLLLVKMKVRKSRYVEHVRCINSDEQRILVKDNDIKERYKKIF